MLRRSTALRVPQLHGTDGAERPAEVAALSGLVPFRSPQIVTSELVSSLAGTGEAGQSRDVNKGVAELQSSLIPAPPESSCKFLVAIESERYIPVVPPM